MPRKPKFIHPVRQLRNLFGVTQARFAGEIGISHSALQRIELGSLKLSSKLAERIQSVTGCSSSALMEGKLLDRRGLPFAPLQKLDRTFREPHKMHVHESEWMAKELSMRVGVLLRVAQEHGCFDLVASDLWSAIDDIRKNFGLETSSEERLHEETKGGRAKWRDLTIPGGMYFVTDEGVQELPPNTKMGELSAMVRNTKTGFGRGYMNNGVMMFSMPSGPLSDDLLAFLKENGVEIVDLSRNVESSSSPVQRKPRPKNDTLADS